MEGQTNTIKDWELLTQEYSVLISDDRGSSFGSGILYYQGKYCYVFTCAHVIEDLNDPMIVYILLPKNRNCEEYDVLKVLVEKSQVAFSSSDRITQSGNCKRHSVDAAVICFPLNRDDIKNAGIELDNTQYYIGETSKNERVFFQGYPGGNQSGNKILDNLDITHAEVLHNPRNEDYFQLKLHDDAMDLSNRLFETAGFSGSPVWSADKDVLSMVGMIASGDGQTVYRSKVKAIKAAVIRNIMKERFDISMESKLLSVPEDEIAKGYNEITIDGTIKTKTDDENIYDKWLVAETSKVRGYIDQLQFQKAIDTGEAATKNSYFDKCSKEIIKKHYQHLLYCYESCLLDEKFEMVEEEFVNRGMAVEHDSLRWMTRNFGKRNFNETLKYTESIITKKEEKESIIELAKVFNLLSRAATDMDSLENTILKIVDSSENLIINLNDKDTEPLVYQMVGFVYSNHYKNNKKAVRCLNRAYRLSSDYAVLESLACAYHDLALQGALRDDGTVIISHIDTEMLNKSRECFLLLIEKADDLYFTAMLKREGMVIYDVFYFLHDNYRVLTLYPRLKPLLPAETTVAAKRDFEMKYARTICQGGMVNLNMFEHLTEEDRVLINLLGTLHGLTMNLDNRNPKGLAYPEIEQAISQTIEIVEKNIDRVEQRERESVRIPLINLYGLKRRIFGCDVAQQMSVQVDKLKDECSDKEHFGYLMSTMENFLYENTHSPEKAEQHFIDTYSTNPNLENWMEILQYYKRNWMLDKADAMFRELFSNHQDLVKEDGEEYAYRAYIDYIVSYQRDIKDALAFYLAYKDKMHDKAIRDFWYYELLMYTSSFNNPKDFEDERAAFADKGLIPNEEFHRTSLIAYMCNLDAKNAWRHYSDDNPLFGCKVSAPILSPNGVPIAFMGQAALTKEGAQFLIWQKKFPPHTEGNWNGMLPSKVERTLEYRGEDWCAEVKSVLDCCKLKIEKSLAIDAWGMFLLTSKDILGKLEQFDTIYVTHITVARMLEEMCHYRNPALEAAIAWLETSEHVRILSPDFAHQLLVREKAKYYEPESTVALALQLNCPALIGEPELGKDCIDSFSNRIIRPNQIDMIIEYINLD